MPFSASAVFFFLHRFHIGKTFPFEESSSSETNKKSGSGQDQVKRGVGHRGQAVLGQKLLNTQHGVGRCAYKSPIIKWANMLKESSK